MALGRVEGKRRGGEKMEQEREERKGRNRGEKREAWGSGIKDSKGTWGEKKRKGKGMEERVKVKMKGVENGTGKGREKGENDGR